MIEQYKRIVSLVCLACYETDKCKKCNVEEMAKRIIDDTRAEVIEKIGNYTCVMNEKEVVLMEDILKLKENKWKDTKYLKT